MVSSNAVLTQEPVIVHGPESAVYGIVGSITDSTYFNPEPTVWDTQFVYADGPVIRMVDFDGGYTVNYSPPGMVFRSVVTVDKYGLVYYSSALGAAMSRLNTINRTNAVMRTGLYRGASVNFSGTRCFYYDSLGNLKFSNLDGSAVSTFGTPPGGIYGENFVGDDVVTYVNGSGAAAFYTVTGSFQFSEASAMPGTGSALADRFLVTNSLGVPKVVSRYGGFEFPVDFGTPCYAIAMSPDGEWVAARTAAGLQRRDLKLTYSELVTSYFPTSQFAWGYLPRAIKLVGTGSSFFTSAAGVASGMKRGAPRSYAVWDVTTRTTATLRQDSGNSSGGTVVLIAEGDQISSFKFTNDRRGYPSAVSAAVGVNTAVIAFDDATGKIASVTMFAVTRSSAKPAVERNGKDVTIRGDVVAVYDGEGKNLAPAGARSVVVSGLKVTPH